MITIFYFFFINVFPVFNGFDEVRQGCEKCSIEILVRTESGIEKLSLEDVQNFFCTIEDSCRVNVEFSEFSSELLSRVFTAQPLLSVRALNSASKNSCETILNKLADPNDAVDLNVLHSNIARIKGYDKIKERVLLSIETAIEKYKSK